MRWTDRIVGLGSTLVLARLLTPADFGLVAMAMVVVGLVDVLLDLGVGAALIQNKDATREDFDTAWTMRLCQAIVAATIISAGAPGAAAYYHDPRVADLLRVIAVSIVVGGFENIGIVMFQKNMEFGRDFRFFFAKRLAATTVTITLALWLRSYWALVLGSMFSRVAGVALSYLMHEFRPRISLRGAREIWSFSQWNMIFSVGYYLSTKLDKLILGRRTNAAVLGSYELADEIASLPTTELLAPMGRVMFPMFVETKTNPVEFARVVRLAFASQALLGLPAGIGVALVAPDAVPLVLGPQWYSAIPLAQTLGIVGAMTSLMHSGYYVLMTTGRIKWLAMFFVGQVSALLLLLETAFRSPDPRLVAYARLTVAVLALLTMLAMVRQALENLRLREVLGEFVRPALGSAVMAVIVVGCSALMADANGFVRLVALVFAGGTSYAITTWLVWRLAGKPKGAETYLLQKMPGRIQRLFPLAG
jgi:lipopolysaccharide exporter